MHELSIATNIIEIVCEKANTENVTKINSIALDIGSLSGVMLESLQFCFSMACKNTKADGAKLIINDIQASALCKTCKKDFVLENEYSACPSCKNFNYKLLQGKELSIKSINVN